MGPAVTMPPPVSHNSAAARRLENIRRQVATGKNDDQALRRAATELESLFIHLLLKEMRATVPESGLTGGGAGRDIHTTLIDMQLSRKLAREGGIGLADMIFNNLKGERGVQAYSNAKKLTLTTKALSDIDRQTCWNQ